MIVEQIIGRLEETDIGNRELDLVMLDHSGLLRPHQKVKTQHGKTIAVSLPMGEHLFKGAVLYANDTELIAVDLMEEDVFEIKPRGNLEWARVAFNIGNMHQAAYVSEEDICIPFDPVMEKMLQTLHVEYCRKTRKMDGIRANAGNAAGDHHHAQEQSYHAQKNTCEHSHAHQGGEGHRHHE